MRYGDFSCNDYKTIVLCSKSYIFKFKVRNRHLCNFKAFQIILIIVLLHVEDAILFCILQKRSDKHVDKWCQDEKLEFSLSQHRITITFRPFFAAFTAMQFYN
jgi:hypothetical protein